jgi:hypothetical protein
MNDLTTLDKKIDWNKLTPAKRGDIIHATINGLRDSAKQIDNGWLKIGMYWHFIVTNKLYRHCGDHIKNANDFLREIDIGVKRSMLDHYSRMWGMFSKYLKDRHVPIRKLLLMSPVIDVDNPDNIEEWLNKAEHQPYEALKNEVREKQGKVATDVCEHPEDYQELWARCGKCEKWLQKISSSKKG